MRERDRTDLIWAFRWQKRSLEGPFVWGSATTTPTAARDSHIREGGLIIQGLLKLLAIKDPEVKLLYKELST